MLRTRSGWLCSACSRGGLLPPVLLVASTSPPFSLLHSFVSRLFFHSLLPSPVLFSPFVSLRLSSVEVPLTPFPLPNIAGYSTLSFPLLSLCTPNSPVSQPHGSLSLPPLTSSSSPPPSLPPSLLAFPPLSLLSRSRVDPYSTALSRGKGKGAVDKGSNCSEEEQARLPKLVHTVSISRNATVLHALAQGERLSVERLSVCPLRCMQCH